MTLLYLVCAWLVGIYVGSLLDLQAWVPAAGALLCAAVSLALRRHPRWTLGLACLAALLLGLWRYEIARPKLLPGPLAVYNDGERVTLRGVVANDPVPRDRSARLHVTVHEINADGAWVPTRGLVLAQVPSYLTYRYGDELELSGKLETPRDMEGFDYRAYLARQGIHSLVRYPHITVLQEGQGQGLLTILYGLKRRTMAAIAAILPEPEAALLSGILLGSEDGIPTTLMDSFRATGTAHIIAISGFNVALLSAVLVGLFSRFLQRYWALVAAVAAIALYAVLVGAEPPVVRAAIMGGLAALALIVGRRSDALTSLFAAAWAMTTWSPFTLWDTGFQLSFAASLGLVVYGDRLAEGMEKMLARRFHLETAQRVVGLLRDLLLVTLAAQITVLPWMVYCFQQFSALSLVANLLILPAQPAVVYLGSTAAMAGLALRPLGQVLGWVAWLFLTYTVRVVEFLAPLADRLGVTGRIHLGIVLAYYALLALLTSSSLRQRLFPPRAGWVLRKGEATRAAFAVGALALLLVWGAVASLPDGKLHVAFLDVGQGDAILVQTPTGRRLLIDGGPSPAALLAALGRRLPFWDRRIDLVLLSHGHDDHLRGLFGVVERYGVRQVLMGGVRSPSSELAQWQKVLGERGTTVLVVDRPWQVDFGDGPVLEVLPPVGGNEADLDTTSLVARLAWDRVTVLFTGDLEADGLWELSEAGWPLACTVLKVPHHGSAEAVTAQLLSMLRPDWAVISVGAENRFGHPAPSTLDILKAANARILRTDLAGTVEFVSDGQRYWVRTGNGSWLQAGGR